MGIFKEEVIFLEGLARRQQQIWPDAADHGVLTKDLSIDEWTRLRETIRTLLELPGSEITYKADKPAIQRSYKLVVMWGHYHGVEILISYYKKNAEFFSISMSNIFKREN